jgi:tetratricopeptide (TPR) repeat protein
MTLALYLDSTIWFRLKKADFYQKRQEYSRAIEIYKKILRKDSLAKKINVKTLFKINFSLGYLYASLDLDNLSIKHYAKGAMRFLPNNIDRYYCHNDLDKNKLLAIGLIEAGCFKEAKREFEKLGQLYPDFKIAQNYINLIRNLEKNNIIATDDNFLFLIGDYYIKSGLFQEARDFFTKRIIDYGISYLRVLTYLNTNYSQNKDIVKRVWGGNIYISLEDFEDLYPKFIPWLADNKEKLKRHLITNETAYQGSYSELLDLTSSSEGANYWVRPIMIKFDKSDFKLGIRIFKKGPSNVKSTLRLGLVYPKEDKSGIYPTAKIKDRGDGWQEYAIENIYENLKIRDAKIFGWNTEGFYIDKIIWDTQGAGGTIYLDSLELFIHS